MRIAILGGGQLGRMMALAGYPLGLAFRALDEVPNASMGQVAPLVSGNFRDPKLIASFCEGIQAATYEWENVPLEIAREVESRVPYFFPATRALEMAQDRFDQKTYLTALGLETAPFAAIDSLEELTAAVTRIGVPAVLKTRRHGYDGKGQFVLRAASDVDAAWKMLGGSPLVLEGFIPFDREVSIVAARSRTGEFAAYAVAENKHRDGILRVSIAPAPGLTSELQTRAEQCARKIMAALDYVGVLAIEFFEVQGNLLLNEVATRVHNSGHWTQDGAVTSQFENHLRAGLGLRLGSTALRGPMAMVNLIGRAPTLSSLAAIEGARIHLYGKEPRIGRKLGHVNVPLQKLDEVLRAVGSEF